MAASRALQGRDELRAQARWSREVAEAARDSWFMGDWRERTVEQSEFALEWAEALGTPVSGELAAKLMDGIGRTGWKRDYIGWIRRMWAQNESAALASREDWFAIIEGAAHSVEWICKEVEKRGGWLPEHDVAIELHGAWGIPDEPLGSEDLDWVRAKLLREAKEIKASRAHGEGLSLEKVLLAKVAGSIWVSDAESKHQLDVGGRLASVLERARIAKAVEGAPAEARRSGWI